MKTGFGQFCPVAVACEVFAERWTPMILRELFAGSEHFNQIHRGVPLMSRALLARRLRELEDAGVISKEAIPGRRGHAYKLTAAGQEFKPVLEALGNWGQRWTVRVQRHNLDAGFLMWNVRRRIVRDLLPEQRVVACFRFSGVPRTYRGPHVFWLVLERNSVELCIEDPGFDIDVEVHADLATLAGVWLGDLSFEEAVRSKGVQLFGPRRLTSAFPSWLMLSHYARVPRPGEDERAPLSAMPQTAPAHPPELRP
ncbi:MAG TPA: helix-turn-helix domain-containing protein [Casimicrobiaceae bacterium]|nr:helix-turn-helix domain-containing protein [Casimicrobiaceae bacterium]